MAIEQPDDFSINLAALGIGFSLEESSVGVPVLNGADVMATVAGNRPPASSELTPLPLRDARLAHLVSHPIMDLSVVPDIRSRLTDNVRWLISEPQFELRADEETVDDFRLGASEALQNGVRAGGIVEINLKRTSTGLIYFDVHNLPADFPPNSLHSRPGQQPLKLGRRKQLTKEATHDLDEGGWGMYLIGSVATSELGRPAVGLYDKLYFDIPIRGTDRMLQVTRKVVWATYGKPAQPQSKDSLARAA